MDQIIYNNIIQLIFFKLYFNLQFCILNNLLNNDTSKKCFTKLPMFFIYYNRFFIDLNH